MSDIQEPYTDQTCFDKVAKHLLAQGGRALRYPDAEDHRSRECAYRSPDGRTCAIGCLIPDEIYQVRMEGVRAHVLIRDYLELSWLLGDVDQGLVLELQACHDAVAPEAWREQLMNVARHRCLSTEVLGA